MKKNKYKLSLGPCLFNWKVNDWRDFYFKIAEESVYNEVYLGEVVCYKRYPFFEIALDEVIKKLINCGKKVNISTFSLILSELEMNTCKKLLDLYKEDLLIEVNDVGLLGVLRNQKYIIGPTINIYNEGTLKALELQGAVRFCFPYELDSNSIKILSKATMKEKEVFVFGRMPLAIAARCYHARVHKTSKDDCKYVCEKDYNGKPVNTLGSENFLTINGTQTMSYSYNNLIQEIKDMKTMGVNVFRVSPHHMDMLKIGKIFLDVIEDKMSGREGFKVLSEIMPEASTFSNGFYYNSIGRDYNSKQVE